MELYSFIIASYDFQGKIQAMHITIIFNIVIMLINTGNKYQLWYLIVYNLKIDIYNFYRSKIKFKNKNNVL